MKILKTIMGRFGRVDIGKHAPGVARVDIVQTRYKHHVVSLQIAEREYSNTQTHIMSLAAAENLMCALAVSINKANKLHGRDEYWILDPEKKNGS